MPLCSISTRAAPNGQPHCGCPLGAGTNVWILQQKPERPLLCLPFNVHTPLRGRSTQYLTTSPNVAFYTSDRQRGIRCAKRLCKDRRFCYFHFWSISRSFRFACRAISSTVSTGMPPRSATYAGDLFRSSADITSRSSSGRYIRL